MEIKTSLRALSLYPINPDVVANICEDFGLDPEAECDANVRGSDAYAHAKGRVFEYLAQAPDVNEAGASYTLTDEQRAKFLEKAKRLLQDIDDTLATGVECGYIGEDF